MAVLSLIKRHQFKYLNTSEEAGMIESSLRTQILEILSQVEGFFGLVIRLVDTGVWRKI